MRRYHEIVRKKLEKLQEERICDGEIKENKIIIRTTFNKLELDDPILAYKILKMFQEIHNQAWEKGFTESKLQKPLD